jgi:periplasmic protein TonB
MRLAASALLLATTLMASAALASPPHVDPAANNTTIYPKGSQSLGEEGVVTVNAFVRQNGRATRVKLLNSSGYIDLDTAAIQTVMNWKFIPAMEGGQPTDDWTKLQIVYKLPDAPAKSNP